jgi:hypothetical protein
VLSRGKHRNPRKGACFMEYASYLAGERWSDHPSCTHPLLAGAARAVNDHTSDSGRSDLVEMIPSVIGLTGDHPAIDAGIAVRCAAVALPVVAERRQKALAAGLFAAKHILDQIGDTAPQGIDTSEIVDRADLALARAPHAAEWAAAMFDGNHLSPVVFQVRSAPVMVRVSLVGIAEACIPDPDEVLHNLLTLLISDCTRWLDPASSRRNRRTLGSHRRSAALASLGGSRRGGSEL